MPDAEPISADYWTPKTHRNDFH